MELWATKIVAKDIYLYKSNFKMRLLELEFTLTSAGLLAPSLILKSPPCHTISAKFARPILNFASRIIFLEHQTICRHNLCCHLFVSHSTIKICFSLCILLEYLPSTFLPSPLEGRLCRDKISGTKDYVTTQLDESIKRMWTFTTVQSI